MPLKFMTRPLVFLFLLLASFCLAMPSHAAKFQEISELPPDKRGEISFDGERVMFHGAVISGMEMGARIAYGNTTLLELESMWPVDGGSLGSYATVAVDFPRKGMDTLLLVVPAGAKEVSYGMLTYTGDGFNLLTESYSNYFALHLDLNFEIPDGACVEFNDSFIAYYPGKFTNPDATDKLGIEYATALQMFSYSYAEFPRFLLFQNGRWRYDSPGEFSKQYLEFFQKTQEVQPNKDTSEWSQDDLLRFRYCRAVEGAYAVLMSGMPDADKVAGMVILKSLPKKYAILAPLIVKDIQYVISQYSTEPLGEQHRFELR